MLRTVAGPTLPPQVLGVAPNLTTQSDASTEDPVQTWITAFTDSMGNRRRVDRPLLADIAHASPGPAPNRLDPEEALWWSLHDRAALSQANIDLAAGGPLFEPLRQRGIEWWTQAELSGVHALSILGLRDNDAATLARVERCALWLLDEVQPDNATQLPWAVHIFAAIASDTARPAILRTAARHYAQTLVHNALVNTGQPDPFAACILWSSAAWLDAGTSPRAPSTLPLCADLRARHDRPGPHHPDHTC